MWCSCWPHVWFHVLPLPHHPLHPSHTGHPCYSPNVPMLSDLRAFMCPLCLNSLLYPRTWHWLHLPIRSELSFHTFHPPTIQNNPLSYSHVVLIYFIFFLACATIGYPACCLSSPIKSEWTYSCPQTTVQHTLCTPQIFSKLMNKYGNQSRAVWIPKRSPLLGFWNAHGLSAALFGLWGSDIKMEKKPQ